MTGQVKSPTIAKSQTGFSLMELLVILAIVAILAIGGTVMMGSRQSGAVRSLLDDLEGSIANAHQAAIASSRDTALACWGAWDKDNPLRIAYGDARILQSAGGPANFMKIANEILAGNPPTPAKPILPVTEVSVTDQQTVAVAFQYSPNDSIQRRAAIVVEGSDNWDRAKGKSDDIEGVPPFTTDFINVLKDDNNFCKGQSNDVSQVSINGYTKRFTRTVFIKIVTINSSGGASPNAPMGLIVLMENSASVFRFYNPGTENGDGKWRRI
ncbi:MAG: prepilin-type N-terminal cleavage/methylation domain-containing protein [Holophagales bacterium]|nr:prepilin-type N-terminal cleavage/methylation domain-containing protein [Holophagales bacterium]